jgi:FkbM family methyltransferase
MNVWKLISKIGFKVNKYLNESSALNDITTRVKDKNECIIFDIGGNVGQTIGRFKKHMPNAIIYSFEPQQSSFQKMDQKYRKDEKVILIDKAVGSVEGRKSFDENEESDMSSFLKLDNGGWGKIVKTSMVDVTTVDEYCKKQNIEHIDVLKSDTQGYDYEVFKGAANMMKGNKIHMILFEFILSDMYKNQPSFSTVFQYLIDNNFRLVNIYNLHHKDGLVSWGDALFLNKNYT